MATLIRNPAAFSTASPVLNTEHFGQFDRTHAICWACTQKIVERTGKLPGRAALTAAVDDAAAANPNLLNEAEREETSAFIELAFAARPAGTAGWEDLLRAFLEDRLANRAVAMLNPPHGDMLPADLPKALERLCAEAARIAAVGNRGGTFDLGRALTTGPEPQYAPAVIDKYLRRGELMNLIAAPKVGKSWASLALAVAAAAGRRWCGQQVARGRVLLVDGELPRSVLLARAKKVMAAMDVAPADVGGRLDVLTGRGTKMDVGDVLRLAAAGRYDLVILDPLYRLLRPGQTEIDDAAMRELYDGLLLATARTGCALVVVHHLPKGAPWQRSTIDSGAGSNVSARSADTHAVLRWADDAKGDPDTDGAITLTASCRTFPPPPAVLLRRRAGDAPILVPADAGGGGGAGGNPDGRDLLEAMRFAGQCARPDPETKTEIMARADDFRGGDGKRISGRRANLLFSKCVTAGFIEAVPQKGGRRYRRPQDAAERIATRLTDNLVAAAPAPAPAPAPPE